MKKKLVLIGATGGIGSAVVKLLQNDYEIIATGTNQDILKKLEQDFGVKSMFFDHMQNNEKEFVDQVSNVFQKIDALVVTSGITSDSLAINLNDELWDKTLQINLTSVFKLVKNFYRKLNNDSSIVLTSSVIARTGNIGQVAYAASKAGLEAMIKTLAKEFARKCTINVVAPGFIETNMTKNLDKEAILNSIPLKRMGMPEEVAFAINFLISDQARYITGHTLEINGGMFMV